MKYRECVIAWSPIEGSDLPPVKVVRLPRSLREPDYARGYYCTGGAAYDARQKATGDAARRFLFSDFLNLTLDHGIPPKEVYEAFRAIDEFEAVIVDYLDPMGI